MKRFLALIVFNLFITDIGNSQQAEDLHQIKKNIISHLDESYERYAVSASKIWSYAELGYQEKQSSAHLQSLLEEADFEVSSNVAGMPTAFVASYGSGSPVIGILAEYDALPGISQDAVPERKVLEAGAPGHACGHHLFGVGSVAAGIAIKDWLNQSNHSGTIRVYGTPAEEGGAGKVYMVRAGLFDDVDAVLHWHPSSSNSADAASSLANKSAKFRFHGIASHAAGSPWNGRSALDGVEAMNHMTNMLREHIPMESRIHYVITRGGEAPNIVPEFAEVFYYCRHPDMEQVKENFERIVKAAEGAALGTGTTMDYEVIHGLYNVLPNEQLARKMHRNLEIVGGVKYTEEEIDFGQRIQTTLIGDIPDIRTSEEIRPFQIIEKGNGGSTDVGDVSWAVPTAGLRTATWVPGTSAHSWQAVAAGGTAIGHKGMMVAAKTIALTAVDLYHQSEVITKAREELLQRRGDDFRYESLLGDREPPLDYRN